MAETLRHGRSRLRACLDHLEGDGKPSARLGTVGAQGTRTAGIEGARTRNADVTTCGASALGGIVCGCAGFLLGASLAYQKTRLVRSEREVIPPPPPGPALIELAEIPESTEDERHYLQMAFDAKYARRPPGHSGFRVTAVVVYVDKVGQRRHVIGHNAEVAQPALTSAICAERDAMTTALGSHHSLVSLEKIYIISDAPVPITPGNLCREFLSEYGEPTTPLLLVAAADPSHRSNSAIVSRRITLGELYPHPPILRRVPRAEAIQRSSDLVAAANGAPFGPDSDHLQDTWPLDKKLCAKLYEKVHALALGDAGTRGDIGLAASDVAGLTDDDEIHPIRIAAGAMYSNGQVVATTQKKALEYGCTSDAVVQLMPFLLGEQVGLTGTHCSDNESTGRRPVLLMQVDQCGLLHAPAAAARAVLVEHGSGDLCVAVHAKDAEGGGTVVVCTTAANLAPALPTQMLEMESCA